MTDKQVEPETPASLMQYAAVRLHYEMTGAKAALAAQRAELADFAKTAGTPHPAPHPQPDAGQADHDSPPPSPAPASPSHGADTPSAAGGRGAAS